MTFTKQIKTFCLAVLIFALFCFSSCTPISKPYLSDLAQRGKYEVYINGLGVSESVEGILEISERTDALRDYKFTYTAPATLCGVTETRENGKIVLSLENFEPNAQPKQTLASALAELFDPGKILSVTSGGTYTEIKCEKATYCVDNDGKTVEIIIGKGRVKIAEILYKGGE